MFVPFIAHSALPRQSVLMRQFLLASLVVAAGAGVCADASAAPKRGRECYSTGETREKIAANEAAEPFRAMQKAAARLEAQALAARLCRASDGLVYEISLLRSDGRVIRSIIDAKTGQVVDGEAEKK